MPTGFTWCIPIKSKKATDVARAYMQHVYSTLGGSTKILTDNGTEFSVAPAESEIQLRDFLLHVVSIHH